MLVQVSARSQVVLKRAEEGSEVKQGEVLFLIDPALFKADLDSALAALRKSQHSPYRQNCKTSVIAHWLKAMLSAVRTMTTPAHKASRR